MDHLELVGISQFHRVTLERLGRIAVTDAEVLVTGPSGVGKELYARYIHDHSHRRAAPFVPVNCGALPGELLENELFGHVAGAFTGARPNRRGLVAEAEGGTLFLDEVDALVLGNQVKLLRLLQEREYRPLGESRVRRANVRFVTASNADLQDEVRAGRFRLDLFFRLRVVPVHILPLRERAEDIDVLLDVFADRYAREYKVAPLRFTDDARRRLRDYHWPGNVRELENCVRCLACLSFEQPIHAGDLPLLDICTAPDAGDGASPPGGRFQDAKRDVVNRFERDYIESALRVSNGNIAHAAESSGKARRAFFELMRKHGLRAEVYRGDGKPVVEALASGGAAEPRTRFRPA
jgi:DNA-binding NtrC family response regulator